MKITTRDWVQLSSYLDGEMSPQELKRMEDRVKNDPVFQDALEELRYTKITLGKTPTLKVPRNFTLTSEMVGSRPQPRPRQARVYSLAAALMSFMLVGVLLLDFSRGFMSGAMAPAAPKEVMLEAFSEFAADALEEPAVMVAEGELESDRAAVGTETESMHDEEAAAPGVAAEAVEEGESLEFAQETETKSTGEEDTDLAANQSDEWQEEDTAEGSALPTQTIGIEISGTSIPTTMPPAYFPDEGKTWTARIDPFRILEVFFALGVLGFGTAAWLSRRRKS